MRHTATQCLACPHWLLPRTVLRRHPHLRERFREHSGRGLCQPCYHRAVYADDLADYERRTWPADVLLDEWVRLRDERYGYRLAAARLGVTPTALDRALCRAKRRGDPRGNRAPFGRQVAS